MNSKLKIKLLILTLTCVLRQISACLVSDDIVESDYKKSLRIAVVMPVDRVPMSVRLSKDEITMAALMAATRALEECLIDVKGSKAVHFGLNNIKIINEDVNPSDMPFIVGIMNDNTCYTLGKFYATEGKNIPIISIGCRNPGYSIHANLMQNIHRIGGRDESFIESIFLLLKQHPAWKKVILFSSTDSTSVLASNIIKKKFEKLRLLYNTENGLHLVDSFSLPVCTSTKDSLMKIREEFYVHGRWDLFEAALEFLKFSKFNANVFILVMPDCGVVQVMRAAKKLGMFDYGFYIRYAFITYAFTNVNPEAHFKESDPGDVAETKKSLEGLLTVNINRPLKTTWFNFDEKLRLFRDQYNAKHGTFYELSYNLDINTALVFDGIYILMQAIHHTHSDNKSHVIWDYRAIDKFIYELPTDFSLPSSISASRGYFFKYASGAFKVHREKFWNPLRKEWIRINMRFVDLAVEIIQQGQLKVIYEINDQTYHEMFADTRGLVRLSYFAKHLSNDRLHDFIVRISTLTEIDPNIYEPIDYVKNSPEFSTAEARRIFRRSSQRHVKNRHRRYDSWGTNHTISTNDSDAEYLLDEHSVNESSWDYPNFEMDYLNSEEEIFKNCPNCDIKIPWKNLHNVVLNNTKPNELFLQPGIFRWPGGYIVAPSGELESIVGWADQKSYSTTRQSLVVFLRT
ncbi:hypothetical protein HELRODRAFT_181907 [Helobdella robusta]|uniref:Receptor ligand binding region domain-containing protein n=1 Tax=Helobdella robusta TaxID=6412 RepID=T1FHG4_HELRO|nr:hypothetical protein HELRODRAFT_181907 [Helobdella robusta]ESN91983.1 hypothetical protein HELRODRAFT_181907 [Helobdella robusta]